MNIMSSLPCDLCDAVLSRIDHLREHREIQHYGLRYKCQFCESQYTTRYRLRAHLSEAHSFRGAQLPDTCRIFDPAIATHPLPSEYKMVNGTSIEMKGDVQLSSEETLNAADADESLLVPLLNNRKRKLQRSPLNQTETDGPTDDAPTECAHMPWKVIASRIQWSHENYLQLVQTIGAYSILLNTDAPFADRSLAWTRIYEEMLENGMPQCSMRALQAAWERLQYKYNEAIAQYKRDKLDKVKDVTRLSPINQAIHGLLKQSKRGAHENQMKPAPTAADINDILATPGTSQNLRQGPLSMAKQMKLSIRGDKSNVDGAHGNQAKPAPTAEDINDVLATPTTSQNLRQGSSSMAKQSQPHTMPMVEATRSASALQVQRTMDKYAHLERLELRVKKPMVHLRPLPIQSGDTIRVSSKKSLVSAKSVVSTPEPEMRATPPPRTSTTMTFDEADTSMEFQKWQKEAIYQDAMYKKVLRQHEEERLEFDRKINSKRLTLMEFEIKKIRLEVDQMQRAANQYGADS